MIMQYLANISNHRFETALMGRPSARAKTRGAQGSERSVAASRSTTTCRHQRCRTATPRRRPISSPL